MAFSRLSGNWLLVVLAALSVVVADACGAQGSEMAKSTSVGSNETLASPAASSGHSGWQTIFANLDWYLRAPGPEAEFSGIVHAAPAAGGNSSVQRSPLYTLGNRAVYTASQRLPSLDALIGQAVVIRGKSVQFALEGTQIHEIWPAAIRPAGP